ncbi:MAG TPA: S1C family serine protease, partial [Nitrososphaera sp.]|nr:S1C family serine protease [Nitrososphaera sp.]
MHKQVAILGIISIILASILAIQVMHDGGLTLGQLRLGASTVKNIQATEEKPQNTIAKNDNIEKVALTDSTRNSVNINDNSNASAILDAQSIVFNQIFKKAGNSVVQITSKVNSVVPNIIINGNPLQSQSTRLGSGFVFDAAKGLIITNNHVVQDSKTVDVTFIDG